VGVALTPYQRARWLECRLARDGPPAAGLDVRVRGPVDAEALRRRLDRLAERHAALRTTVHDGDDGPVAVVHERARVDLRLKPASRDQVLSLRADPVALDARSLGLTLLELLGRPASPAPTPAPAPVDDERDRAYWEGRLAGEMGALDLTSGRRREGRAATGVAVTAELGAARRDRLLRLAAGCAVPIHAALLAALQLLLRRYTGEPDVVIGLPVALVADAIGWHANSVVLRQELSGDGTARDLMRATARTLAEAVEHRASPIERLVGRLDPARGRAGGPFPVVATIDAATGAAALAGHWEARKQAAIADRLLITKTDIAAEDDCEQLVGSLRRLNPAAPIHQVVDGEIDPALLFGVGPLDLARRSPGFAEWLGETAVSGAHHEHHHEIQPFCLTAEAPLDWARFHDWLGGLRLAFGERLLRVKGILDLVGEDGPVVVHGVQHIFHPPVSLPRWPDADRRSRLVLIARGLDRRFVEESWRVVTTD